MFEMGAVEIEAGVGEIKVGTSKIRVGAVEIRACTVDMGTVVIEAGAAKVDVGTVMIRGSAVLHFEGLGLGVVETSGLHSVQGRVLGIEGQGGREEAVGACAGCLGGARSNGRALLCELFFNTETKF